MNALGIIKEGMRTYRGEERDWGSWIVENCLSCPTKCVPYLCTLSFKLWHFTKLLIHICSNSGYHLNWPIWQERCGLMPCDFSPLLSPACTCYRELQVVGNRCSWDSQRKTGNYSSRHLSIKKQWYPLYTLMEGTRGSAHVVAFVYLIQSKSIEPRIQVCVCVCLE